MGKGFLVLCFDDGYVETYSIAYPVLMNYGMTAVIGVITSFVGGIWRDWNDEKVHGDYQLATLSQLQEMRTEGLEMASHSLTHSPHEWIYGRIDNREYLEMSLKESRDWIVRNKLGDGRTFLYPFGVIPENIEELVRKYYWLGRSTSPNRPVYHDLPLNSDQRYRLWSYEVQHPISEKKLHEIRGRIRYATEKRAIITLTFHRITDQPRKYDLTLRELKTVMDIIVEENVVTTTYENIIKKLWG